MKLATFETIDTINNIEGKDKIVLITIKGFELVVQKDKFKVGDMCVYIPPDTVIDRSREWFKPFKYDRVKTEKIAGIYSQGIVITIEELKNIIPDFMVMSEEEIENIDLGSLIGVSKYDKDTSIIQPHIKGKRTNDPLPEFPNHLIPITDEENLKSIKGKYNHILMEELKDKVVNVTMKMDGTSMTLIWERKELTDEDPNNLYEYVFTMASRRFSLYKTTEKSFSGEINTFFDFPDDKTTYIKKHNLRNLFNGFNLAIQGELCGPKIGGNKLKLKELEFFVFTIRNLDTNEYYSYDQIVELCNYNNFKPVPLINKITITEEITVKFLQDIANSIKYGESEGEGIVVRPEKPFFSKALSSKNCSFKLINCKYKD